MLKEEKEEKIYKIYNILFDTFGNQSWWPAETCDEVIIGAILTQQTSWKNVERAIDSLKNAGVCSLSAISGIEDARLEMLIKSSGFYRQKAKRLKNIALYIIENYGSDYKEGLFGKDIQNIRSELLNLNGIGRESADSIILYAASKPIFVIDAYTRRIFSRCGIIEDKDMDYDTLREIFENSICVKFAKRISAHGISKKFRLSCKFTYNSMSIDSKKLAAIYNEFHALIVKLGKDYCTSKAPKCSVCSIRSVCNSSIDLGG